ncbi:MAG TPA: peptide chain release factor 1 [Acidobacteriota bacterium]|nr:peptide chain release factor 1 [Acidobacteriota bacterium]
MFQKLQALEEKYEKLSQDLGSSEMLSNPNKLRDAARAHSELQEIVEKYRQFRKLETGIEDARQILQEESEEELCEMAEEELQRLKPQLEACERELKMLLIPKDPNDEKNVVLEIRAGTGGDEATLFAQEMFRLYSRYAEGRGWKVELLDARESSVGGLKEVVALVEGKGAYSRLKFESGVHRVQRVPETETQGRVHTSAITVAVLPEVDEVEVDIDPSDLRIDTYCSSGPGGQSVNTTYSAVRITHVPSGEVVTCQDEKSQIKNKAKALKVLRSRLFEKARQEQQQEIAESRRAMVGSGDRSEKIRTYNFPQNRVTEHRLGLTLHQLDRIMEGEIDPIIDALVTNERTEALREKQVN